MHHTFGALFTHLAHLFDRVSVPTPFGAKHPLGFVSSGLRTVDYAVQHILAVSADATERAAVYLFHKSLATFRAVGQEMYRLSEDMVRALQLLDLGSAAAARNYVRDQVAAGGRIMGFGHAVYRTEDPRSALLKEYALGFGGARVELAVAVQQVRLPGLVDGERRDRLAARPDDVDADGAALELLRAAAEVDLPE